MHLDSPWSLLLLLAIPVMAWLERRLRRGSAVRFSSTGNAARVGRSWRQRLAGVPLALRCAALALLAVALARPQKGLEQVREISQGIAIEMVVDRSGSMGAELEFRGERMNRLDAVKRVFRDFVLGDGRGLAGRPNDLVGMIAFARYPDTVCPLTLAHGALPQFLDTVHVVQRRPEDGTAIGDALALAAARLKTAEDTLARQTRELGRKYQIKSRVIILLTDGQSNCGRRSPQQAAELAAKWGIKVYTVGIGGEAVQTVRTPFGDYLMPVGPGMDEGTLQAIARTTGGLYRRADTAKALQSVYEEIDRLERSDIEAIRYVDYEERFLPFALAAFALVGAEVLLRGTVFRKAP